MVNEIAREMIQKQEMWLKAVFLKELGEEWYLKTDKEIAMEARRRGYKLLTKHSGGSFTPTYEVWDKDDNVINSFKINLKISES